MAGALKGLKQGGRRAAGGLEEAPSEAFKRRQREEEPITCRQGVGVGKPSRWRGQRCKGPEVGMSFEGQKVGVQLACGTVV